MEELNIREFLGYYRKFIPIIIILAIVFAIGVFIYDSNFKTPVYTAKTSVILVKNDSSNVSAGTTTETIDTSDITLNQKLVATYRKIIKSRLVLDQVIEKAKIDYTFLELDKEVSVSAVQDTEILDIYVTDVNAKRAANIANTIVEIFDQEVTKMYNINNVSFLDIAQIPTSPSNNTTLRDIVLIVLLVFAGCSGVIFLIYYFDDTLRDSETVESEIGMPIIGKVYKNDDKEDLIVEKKPKAFTSENIRTLRTNLQFAAVDSELKTILVTSSVPNEGKSFISANLAIAFAQSGKKVLLIDCDLRKGRQHEIFNISSKKGLSTVLINNSIELSEYAHKSDVNNLYVMSRGVCPPNPSEILSSKKIATFINGLKNHFDLIILDGAPCTGLSDSLMLSSIVDKVIVVSNTNNITKTIVNETRKSLESAGANIAGCVFNNMKFNKSLLKNKYYGTYGYAYGYGYGDKNND